MMQENEKGKFIDLMIAASEALRDPLGSETIEFYWRALKDELPFDVIRQRMEAHAKSVGYRAKRFPLISEILQLPSVEEKAIEDQALLEDLASRYIFSGFGDTGSNIVAMKLDEMGAGHLIPIFNRWGAQMLNSNNPEALRAQMIKHIKTEIKTKEEIKVLPGTKTEINALPDTRAQNLLEGIIK